MFLFLQRLRPSLLQPDKCQKLPPRNTNILKQGSKNVADIPFNSLTVTARAPIMHKASGKLPTPPVAILALSAPSRGARSHKDEPCPFQQSAHIAFQNIQPQQNGRRLRGIHVRRLGMLNDPRQAEHSQRSRAPKHEAIQRYRAGSKWTY